MNGGHAGNLVAPAISLTKAEAGFRVIQGITSVAGTYTGGSDRVSGKFLPFNFFTIPH
jgi:NCS1 family nucleobase:cation symporter-1